MIVLILQKIVFDARLLGIHGIPREQGVHSAVRLKGVIFLTGNVLHFQAKVVIFIVAALAVKIDVFLGSLAFVGQIIDIEHVFFFIVDIFHIEPS